MRPVRLGRTGLPVSRRCLGTMTFGLQCDEPASAAIMDRAAAGGITFLDTAGKHRREAGPTAWTRFTLGSAAERYPERYWHEREFRTVDALRPRAQEAGLPLAGLAVAWTLAHPAITSAIVGASRPEQRDDLRTAADKPISADLKARLDDLTREYRWGDDSR